MKIKDLGIVITGKTPSTKDNKNWENGNIPFVTPSDLQNTKHIFDTERHITSFGMDKVKSNILPPNSICVSCIGNLGYVSMTTKTCISNQQINSIIPFPSINPDYVYYLLKYYWPVFKSFEGQSTALSILNKTQFSDLEIPNHSLQKQEQIASFLSVIDAKIETNNIINGNLDRQAKALFLSMFIDSDERHEWERRPLATLIDSTLGGDWGKESPTGANTEKVYCIRGADIPEVRLGNKGKMPTRFILPKNYSTKRLLPGDIVVEISGGSPTQSTGRVAAVSQSLLDRYDSGMICTNFCRAIKPRSPYSMFVYYYWQYLYERGVFFLYENGTTGIKNLDLEGFLSSEEVLIPPESIVKRFDSFCHICFNTIFANGQENERLSMLRDTLMPKLMSGELDISDIDL